MICKTFYVQNRVVKNIKIVTTDYCKIRSHPVLIFCLAKCFCLHFQQCFLWLYSRHFAWHDVFSHNESLDALPLPCPPLPPSVSLTLPLPLPFVCLSLGAGRAHSALSSTLIWNNFTVNVCT